MGIWIRIQDKKGLIYAKRIFIYKVHRDKEEACTFRIIEQYDCNNNGDDYDVLAEYKTEERAMEVLDNIHDFIDCDGNMNVKSNVFQMPEELKNKDYKSL